jgi:50S ribosomal subunit-associated GTPase HflX
VIFSGFDDELSPSNKKYLKIITECKILDRTHLILDIFAQRAETSYARTQVVAQCQYLLPRLSGMWTHSSVKRELECVDLETEMKQTDVLFATGYPY